jgi:hypothetical protein
MLKILGAQFIYASFLNSTLALYKNQDLYFMLGKMGAVFDFLKLLKYQSGIKH